MYSISIMPSALKELQIIPKIFAVKIISAIDRLAENPRPPGVKKLKGQQKTLYRIRAGDYRAVLFN
jgi:mRNA interferase RelE/StbE